MKNLKKLVKEIKEVKIQGAKAIAIESLKFLKSYARKKGFGKDFERICFLLESIRPTAVVLHNCIGRILMERKEEAIARLLKELKEVNLKLAKIGMKIFEKKSVVLTHCHSSEALSLIKYAWRKGKIKEVYATKTEPLNQGIKTSKELAKEDIPVTLILDSAVGFFINNIDMVIVGCDAIRKEGIINKIGTYQISVLAKIHKKPFYVVGSTFKFDRRKKLKIEERPSKEIWKRIKGVKIRNPAFDLTPWENITALITEIGILKKKDVLKYLS